MDFNIAAVAHSSEELQQNQQTEKQMNEGAEADATLPSVPREGAAQLPLNPPPAGMSDEKSRDGQAATVCQDLTSVRERIATQAQTLIEEINTKRQKDTQLLADFRQSLEDQVHKSCKTTEEAMFATYEKQSEVMQAKLTELFATLDRISLLENELQEFKAALGIFYQDMAD